MFKFRGSDVLDTVMRNRLLLGLLALEILIRTPGGYAEVSKASALRGHNVPRPAIEGPITGGKGKTGGASTTFDLATVGYGEAEYFISGTARAFTSAAPLEADGKWTATEGNTAPYKTRMVVYRPIQAAKFNGTVIVEWLNVSGGLDAAADWIMMHTELIRDGFVWVGVSAQRVGIEGGPALMGIPSTPLKTADPERYASLTHPGDSFSYDIFSQAAQAIRQRGNVDPLGGLRPEAVIAAGESQSAFRMVTYVNAIHPLTDIFDGFLIHSRGGKGMGAAALSQAPQTPVSVPASARIRDDLKVPVFTFQTETDLTMLGSVTVRQDDSDHFRLWEVAGTAHADSYTVVTGMTDRGDSPDAAKLVVTTSVIPGTSCADAINSGPQHFVLNAAIAALNKWVRKGVAPPIAPRIETNGDQRVAIARGPNGNALGGIRTPQLDVPIATFSGEAQPGSPMCMLFGKTVPFDTATLASLYPTHDAYVAAFNAATDRAVKAGFILEADAALMKASAASAPIPQ